MSRTIRYKLNTHEEGAVLAVVNALNKEGYQTDIQDFGKAAILEATQKIIDNSKSGNARKSDSNVEMVKGMSTEQAKLEQAAIQKLVSDQPQELITEGGEQNAEPGIQESGDDVQGQSSTEVQSTEEG